ncbi:hypothetical protein C4K22_0830 [Pseudomonas chlororaphis subsp. aurantiaca]|uniref:hypothetical protein n=1 Tax=Pseudomonas chlororaphis TaxID=587753 RepID=UPI000F562A91|nr:hypothetical protein [Pseudomonas chlororaphis]AZD33595.1 hypothetical protein C4K22_0830 [Pseudomonas chlororaphis subsp. aurantiaca]AZD39925.1 hypothetical protein C4K21_0829 [Pseudomonas chlororaphis subsp. aurantiaca]
MDLKLFILKALEIIKGTIIGKVIVALIAGGLSLIGASPFFDKYISATLSKYLSIETSDPSAPIGMFLIIIAVSLTIWERKNQILIELKKSNPASIKETRPIIDLCHRGISVKEIEPQKIFFDIPYCSGKNANAYNVKLESAVITPWGDGLVYSSGFGDIFPDDITLSYETGKSMHYSLYPFTLDSALNSYIVVKGNYSGETASIYNVFDIFKFSKPTNNWVRALGKEDLRVRKFVQDGAKYA